MSFFEGGGSALPVAVTDEGGDVVDVIVDDDISWKIPSQQRKMQKLACSRQADRQLLIRPDYTDPLISCFSDFFVHRIGFLEPKQGEPKSAQVSWHPTWTTCAFGRDQDWAPKCLI